MTVKLKRKKRSQQVDPKVKIKGILTLDGKLHLNGRNTFTQRNLEIVTITIQFVPIVMSSLEANVKRKRLFGKEIRGLHCFVSKIH